MEGQPEREPGTVPEAQEVLLSRKFMNEIHVSATSLVLLKTASVFRHLCIPLTLFYFRASRSKHLSKALNLSRGKNTSRSRAITRVSTRATCAMAKPMVLALGSAQEPISA